jgi:hypothetical protein
MGARDSHVEENCLVVPWSSVEGAGLRIFYPSSRLAAGSTASLFIHGYSNRDASNYSAIIYNQFAPGVLFPEAHVIRDGVN